MFKKSLRFAASLALALALTACGGGGGGSSTDQAAAQPSAPVKTGAFFAGSVTGLTVKAEDLTSTTDAAGAFQYREGGEATFYVGGINLGTVKGTDVVTPTALDKYSPQVTPRVINIVRFLSTLDADGDLNNGIVISPEVTKAAANMSIDFSLAADRFEADSKTQYALSVLAPLVNKAPALATQMASLSAFHTAMANLLQGEKTFELDGKQLKLTFTKANGISTIKVAGILPNELPALGATSFDSTGRMTILCADHRQSDCYGLDVTDTDGTTISGVSYDIVAGEVRKWTTSAK